MNRQEIVEKVKLIITDTLDVPAADIQEDKTFKDLKADSLDSVETIMEIEKQFDIAIPDNDMEKFTNIGSIIDYIESHTK